MKTRSEAITYITSEHGKSEEGTYREGLLATLAYMLGMGNEVSYLIFTLHEHQKLTSEDNNVIQPILDALIGTSELIAGMLEGIYYSGSFPSGSWEIAKHLRKRKLVKGSVLEIEYMVNNELRKLSARLEKEYAKKAS